MSDKQSDYIFSLTEKAITAVLYDAGTARYCPDDDRSAVSTPVLEHKPAFDFMDEAGLLSPDSYSLSPQGKALFEIAFIYPDSQLLTERISQYLLQNPVVNLTCQAFYGRGKIGIEQLRALLNCNGVVDREVVYSDVVSLLSLLNRFGIAVYDKKNKQFFIKEVNTSEMPIAQYYINPDTPFSNVYNMRKIIRACEGDVFWIDKHFRKEGFEILLDGLPYKGVTTVTIISGTDNVTASAKADYALLKSELLQRNIMLDWRTITNSAFKWHDRWLVAENQCYNIPPVLALIRGQRADILKTKDRLDVLPFMQESISIS